MRGKRLIFLLMAVCAVIGVGALVLIQLTEADGWLIGCAALLEAGAATVFSLFAARSPGKDEIGRETKKGSGLKAASRRGARERGVSKIPGKTSGKEGKEDSVPQGGRNFAKELFRIPGIGSAVYAGAMAAGALLFSAFLLFLSEKLLSVAGLSSLLPLSYMTGPFMAVTVSLILCPLAGEVLCRHVVQNTEGVKSKRFEVFTAGVFYVLLCPSAARILPGLACGMILGRIFQKTRSYILSYGASVVFFAVSLAYQFFVSSGSSAGNAMSAAGLAGFGLIVLPIGALSVYIAENAFAGRKPKFFEIFAVGLVFVIALIVGAGLTAMK